MKIVILATLMAMTYICPSFADETLDNDTTVEVSIDELKAAIDSLESIKPEEYFSKIDPVLKKIDKFVEYRRHICRGEFSISVMDANSANDTNKRRKLTRDEQKACMSELKNARILYTNNLFVARKKYLDYLHTERINKLISIRDEVLKEIQNGGN